MKENEMGFPTDEDLRREGELPCNRRHLDDVMAQECVEAFKPLAEAAEKLKKTFPLKGLAIRFDGPPSHESGRFVEVEIDGKSVSIGEWVQDGDYWLLHLGEDVKVVRGSDDSVSR